MSAYGVHVLEQPGTTTRPREAGQVLFFVGNAAPSDFQPHMPHVIRSMEDVAGMLGKQGVAESPTVPFEIERLARLYFLDYGAAPIVFVNVAEEGAQGSPGSSRLSDGTYAVLGTTADIVGGVNEYGDATGIEALDTVFARTGLVPTMIMAEGLWQTPAIDNALRQKAQSFGGGFRGLALIGLAPDMKLVEQMMELRTGTDAAGPPTYTSPFTVYCGPHVTQSPIGEFYGGLANPDDLPGPQPLTWHVAGAIARAAAQNGGLPFQSPSNQPLVGITQPGVIYSPAAIDAIRHAGIVTVQRAPSGWRLAGNRTGAYWNGEPTSETAEEALRDSFIATRMMANHLNNRLILDTLDYVDDPLSRAQIDRVLDGVRRMGNDLVGRGGSLGFAASFDEADNPATDLADGVVRFRLSFLPPVPMERIEWLVSVDLGYFSSLTA